ncbi:MAG: SPOR domain-containing protein [Trueperaceae bacterium]
MDWIRRNWPDLLIGIALMAVIAGIIATLLTGGSFFPLGQSDGSSNRSQQSSSFDSGVSSRQSEIPGTGSAGNSAENDGAVTNDRTTTGGDDGLSSTDPQDDVGTRQVTVTALPLPGTPIANNIPDTSGEAGAPALNASSSAGDSANSGGSDSPSSGQTPANTVSANTTSAGENQSSAPVSSADSGGTYRISVGAFSGAENAERQAQTFRDAGFPLFIGTQGELSIVLVGPYDQLAEAEQVAERIRNGDFRIEPVIYRFQGDADAAASSANGSNSGSSSTSASASSAPTATSPAATTAAATASSSTSPAPQATAAGATAGRYLQVGAYVTAQSAEPQRVRLEGLGFSVTERVEGTLIKLLVGPFAGNDLSSARSRLVEQGIEHFPR